MQDLIQKLEAIVSGEIAASDRDKSFADSLLNGKWGFKKRGYLTDKQRDAGVTMVNRLDNPPPAAKTSNLERVYSFMMGARKFLKYPKINLLLGDTPLKLYISGARSKFPDTINLVANGDDWYGRVFESGEWHRPRRVDEAVMSKIEHVLEELAEDPATVAVEHGRLTGNCCFCNRKLSDEDHSLKVGFGPVCAKNYGLAQFWKAAAKDDRAPAAAHVAHMLKTGKKLNTQNDETRERQRRVRVRRK